MITEVFIFAPRTLGVTPQSYPAERFFEDTNRFLRLKTPDIPLRELGTADAVRALVTEVVAQEPSQVAWALRLLGCVYRRSIRDYARALSTAVEDAAGEQLDDASRDVSAFADVLQASLESLRAVLSDTEGATSARAVDEFVSLVAEAALTRVIAALDSHQASRAELSAVRKHLADVAVAEYRRRVDQGCTSFAHVGEDNEGLPYRRRILKRAMSSALYLDIGHENAGDLAHNLTGMIAAAAAMLFAIVVAVWAQLKWAMTTWPFIAVMVISYAIKDRIKELGRRTLGKRIQRFAPDVMVKVRVPSTGAVVGTCREWFSVEDAAQLDDEVTRVRHIDHADDLEEMGRPETVMVYRKDVSLRASGLRKGHVNVDGLTDIIRFNLARLRRRMDAPTEVYTLVHPLTQELVEVACGRVYHLNIVLRTTSDTSGAARVELERVRVVLDQKGIRRVERVYPNEGVTDVMAAVLDDLGDSPEFL